MTRLVYVVVAENVAGRYADSVWTKLKAAEDRELEVDGEIVEVEVALADPVEFAIDDERYTLPLDSPPSHQPV